jgi:hypothetical protein
MSVWKGYEQPAAIASWKLERVVAVAQRARPTITRVDVVALLLRDRGGDAEYQAWLDSADAESIASYVVQRDHVDQQPRPQRWPQGGPV